MAIDFISGSSNALVTHRLTITASDYYELPTTLEDEILLGLMQLPNLQALQTAESN